MKEPFDYPIVPYTSGLYVAEECPRAATCLRHITLEHAPVERVFLSIMNPSRLKAIKSVCDYYRSNEKMCHMRGLMRMINAFTVRVADTFRYRMIEYMGRKSYYLRRRGDMSLSLVEQRRTIVVAKELGVGLDEYFSGYVEDYNWGQSCISPSLKIFSYGLAVVSLYGDSSVSSGKYQYL